MEIVNISLIGSNGDEIVFDEASNFVLTSGLSGLGVPSTTVRIDDSANEGGVWRFTKRGLREIDLPVVVFGETRLEVEQNLRRLTNLLNDRNGGTVLRASYNSGEVWNLTDGHYVSGAETVKGEDAGVLWTRIVLSMQFANPFWIRSQAESISVGVAAGDGTLIPHLAEMRIIGSQAIGEIEIENVGDVESFPFWIFSGPADSVEVTSQSGQVFSYDSVIELGESIFVNTENGTVVDQDGVNKYSSLGVSPKLFTLPPGNSVVSVVATGADNDTVISLNYQPRKEIVH